MDITKITRPARRLLKLKYCGAVIVAAGSASRMGGIDKVMAPLGGEPMVVRTVRQFQNCDAIREIVIVTRADLLIPISDLCHGFDKVKAVVVGGNSRDESVWQGLNALSDQVKLVAVQDGARPFADWQLIDRVVRCANSYGAAAPAIPVKDTIKIVKGGIVASTPNRSELQAVQTPQVFDIALLKSALKKAKEDGYESITYMIGGSLGLMDELKKRANLKLSFSKMTFPHQLMRMVLCEEICNHL